MKLNEIEKWKNYIRMIVRITEQVSFILKISVDLTDVNEYEDTNNDEHVGDNEFKVTDVDNGSCWDIH